MLSACTNPTEVVKKRYCVVYTQNDGFNTKFEVPYDMYDCAKRGGELEY